MSQATIATAATAPPPIAIILVFLKELERQKIVLGRDKVIERMRAEVLSMRGSDDLTEVIWFMFQEIQHLGIDTPVCTIAFVNEEKKSIQNHFFK